MDMQYNPSKRCKYSHTWTSITTKTIFQLVHRLLHGCEHYLAAPKVHRVVIGLALIMGSVNWICWSKHHNHDLVSNVESATIPIPSLPSRTVLIPPDGPFGGRPASPFTTSTGNKSPEATGVSWCPGFFWDFPVWSFYIISKMNRWESIISITWWYTRAIISIPEPFLHSLV